MRIEISEQNLSDIFDFKELLKMFKYFSILTGIDVSLHNIDGGEELAFRINEDFCICEMVKGNGYEDCLSNMKYAAEKAVELGEPYIFNCGCMIKCSAPIIFEDKLLGSIACGPVLLWEPDELVKDELKKFIKGKPIAFDNIEDIIKNAKQLDPVTMTSASQMLFFFVNYISREESKCLSQSKKISLQQRQIAELLIEKKQNAANIDVLEKRAKLKKYPAQLEKELIAYVQTGDNNNAKRILNNILGEIFSYSSGNLDIIKAKLYELTAILMRAAVDIGAPLENMTQYIAMYNRILSENTTFEDLCYLTSEIMEAFMAIVYEHRSDKPTNKHLINAINFIKSNFEKNISLKLVADEIFVSSCYLSHLFKDEMNMTFSDYVIKIRMEESIMLLKKGNLMVQDVAYKVGIGDANYFTKVFKKYYGVTPKNYMQIFR